MAFGKYTPAFGRKPGEIDGKPPPAAKLFRAEARRKGMLRRATEALSLLPGPGESVHCLQTGYFDLVMVVPVLCQYYGPALACRLATLTFNGRNLTEICRLIDEKRTASLALLASTFFRNNNKDLWKESIAEVRGRGQRIAAAKCHAKVICLDFGETKLTIEGSANLRTNRSIEQFCIINDPGVHNWHAAWIDDLVNNYRPEDGEEEEGRPASA